MVRLFTACLLTVATALYNKPFPDLGLHESDYVCKLDEKVNKHTFKNYAKEITSIWGSACGRNRGIFVSNPPDGKTYNCGKFPPDWGVTDVTQVPRVIAI
jgi:hypothetical protein